MGLPSRAQQDEVPERKRWWQDFRGEMLVPLGDWDMYRKNGLRIDNDTLGMRLKLNARVFGDVGDVGLNDPLRAAFPQDEGSQAAITQARLTLQGWVFDQGMFKLQMEFADRTMCTSWSTGEATRPRWTAVAPASGRRDCRWSSDRHRPNGAPVAELWRSTRSTKPKSSSRAGAAALKVAT
jgi:hypothetical protein